MVYSTSRCPSCGQVIRRQTNPVKEIGVPFERCRHCGTTYRNSYKEEWITKSPISRFFFFLQAGVWARAFLVPILILAIPMAAFDMSTEVVWGLWPVLSLAWLICGYFIHKKAEQDNIAASIKRTQDPEYLNLLKKAGYTIYPMDETISSPNNQTQASLHKNCAVVTNEKICYCRKCGQKLSEGSLYCNKCGEKVADSNNK